MFANVFGKWGESKCQFFDLPRLKIKISFVINFGTVRTRNVYETQRVVFRIVEEHSKTVETYGERTGRSSLEKEIYGVVCVSTSH